MKQSGAIVSIRAEREGKEKTERLSGESHLSTPKICRLLNQSASLFATIVNQLPMEVAQVLRVCLSLKRDSNCKQPLAT